MKFKKQMFGFMDMLRFKKLVPNRREALASGANTPLPQEYRTNELAKRLHPGMMDVELTAVRQVAAGMVELTFKRLDADAFPFFRAGQYVSLQGRVGESVVSRPYSIVSSPRQALANELVLGVADAGFFSGWLNREAKPGDRFRMSEPTGEFHYETLRDKKQIVCIAGGAGITPFISMARSMADKDEPYEMILFYGARDEAHLAYQAELDELCQKTGLRVVYVLSDEEKSGFAHGFITADLMEQFVDIKECTFFLCGPKAMYDFIDSQLASYQLPVKAVHRDATCCPNLKIDAPRTFRLTVHIRDEVFTMDAAEHETLLTAMERAGVPAPNKCRAGGCGYCHSKWIAGEFRIAEGRDGRREADRKFGFVHPCVTYPLSDMEIDVPAEE
ncbi:MAG TPA: 2Fe-2S iron-sulfur cluster binding domain-containing protein [Candidatus Ruthenibacterium avium]|uniref:2Fe-2S iron-sulfur cluster binding domain-containing protein n=1 Tax=Candidatus Ruthenibacterium avium TaxID=2838751 RepID=A0A9D2S1G3_9FIRM|nr:2Fe-2S iron-sulfur cluster binding domain-containing protein [Candidatus Ruthenibacterium avium]